MPDQNRTDGKPAPAEPDKKPKNPSEEFGDDDRSKTDDRFDKDGLPAD